MKPKRVLVVDDNEDHRLILAYKLRKIGDFEILEAGHGQDALNLMAQQPVDLVFMNLQMPVLDGREAVRRIRSMEGPARDVPIISFTAYIPGSDAEQVFTADCDDYLIKPVIDSGLIREKVLRLLARGRAA
ncbi:MAG: response regulator [Candidatus Binatia bacterium]|nr:response regulator [Candidatus Binatia bacterium]